MAQQPRHVPGRMATAAVFAGAVCGWAAMRAMRGETALGRPGKPPAGAELGGASQKGCCCKDEDFKLEEEVTTRLRSMDELRAAAASLPHSEGLTARDRALIACAYSLRDLTDAPMHSGFNVIAIITCEAPDGSLFTLTGGNNETCNIGGSLCAERSALSKLRWHDCDRIVSVHIVTSSSEPITPGLLCREYLAEVAPQTLRVVLHAQDSCLITTLGELLPVAPIYAGVRRSNVEGYARRFVEVAEKPTSSAGRALLGEDGERLRQEVLAATSDDARDVLHPIRLAAGVLFSDGSIETAAQNKMLEFGSTVDPVQKLAQALELKRAAGVQPKLIVMSDQFGALHAPWARARSYLYEEGFDAAYVVAHDRDGKLQKLTVEELVPECPRIF